jgi:hypothetical protein
MIVYAKYSHSTRHQRHNCPGVTFDDETKDTFSCKQLVNKSLNVNEGIKKSSHTQSSTSILFNSIQCTLLVRVVSSYHSFIPVVRNIELLFH